MKEYTIPEISSLAKIRIKDNVNPDYLKKADPEDYDRMFIDTISRLTQEQIDELNSGMKEEKARLDKICKDQGLVFTDLYTQQLESYIETKAKINEKSE